MLKNEVMDLCKGCPAPCCYNKVVPLTKEEASRSIFEGAVANLLGVSVIKLKEGGACHFLDMQSGLCSIWKDRPHTCKNFSCLEHGI